MYKALTFLLLLYSNVYGEYLIVDNAPIGASSNAITVNSFSESFSPNTLKVGISSVSLKIPIYVKSDSMSNIAITLSNLSNLQNSSDNQEISTSFFYQQHNNSSQISIYNNTPFTLLHNGVGVRDGSTPTGYLIIKANNISNTQTYGTYKLTSNIQAHLANQNSNITNLSIRGDVPLVAVASFVSTSAYQSGQKFEDNQVNYGKLRFMTENRMIKDLFVKSNSNQSFKVTLIPNDLIHQVYDNSIIKMNYYFTSNNGQRTHINGNNYFTAIQGKSDGVKVGEFECETERITASHLAGDYRAVMNVTITLE